MSKIFDALENAQKIGAVPDEAPPPLSSSLPVPDHIAGTDMDMELEMINLYQTITASLPGINCRSILFVGSRPDEGTSTIARELAKIVSLRMEKTVLLMDFDSNRPRRHVYGDLRPERNINEVVKTGESIEKALCRVEESSLYVMPLFQRTLLPPAAIDPGMAGGFWSSLRSRFDLIIVDSPPALMFPDGPSIVAQVDGVILVVEAEKTRWQVALSVKEKVLKSGGNILGMVFNKRRYYIPHYIYKHL